MIYACSGNQQVSKKPGNKMTIEQVKAALSKMDEIPVDSIHVVKLKNHELIITQGFGRVDNLVRLIQLSPDGFKVLDSIQAFQEIDAYRRQKIFYDYV